MICMLIEVRVKPEALEEFLEVITYDARHSEKDEPGCLRFDVLRDSEDPLRFFFYEVYRDEAARLAHRQMPHFDKWAQFMERGLEGGIVRRTTTNVYPSDSAWR